jgi:hypothetical protein
MRRLMSVEQIRECADRVRAALQGLNPEDLLVGLKLFPRGACGGGFGFDLVWQRET